VSGSIALAMGLLAGTWLGNPVMPVKNAEAAFGLGGNHAAAELSDAFSSVAERIGPSVVNISSTKKMKSPFGGGDLRGTPFEFFGDQFFDHFFGPQGPGGGRGRGRGDGGGEDFLQQGLGTGVVVSTDGYIVTNTHVVEGADEVKVKLVDDREFTAKVVGTDPKTDVAVVKIEASGLQAAVLGDSDALKVGQLVIASGNPFGLNATITAGIVSATGRANVGIADYEDFIQTDAAINPGNSGGPLVNLDGEVVGINTAIFSRSGGYMGIGFAIPSNMVKSIMTSLIKEGRVIRGWLGIAIQNLDEGLAKSFGYDSTDGVLVGDVTADSPAATAGLKSGDIIISYNGTSVRKADRLRSMVADTAPGSRATLEVFRDGRRKELDLKIGEMPAEQGEEAAASQEEEAPKLDVGMTVRTLTPDIARELGYKGGMRGVVVTDVDPMGPAAKIGIRPKDVITKVQDQRVDNADDFNAALRKYKDQGGVRLTVKNGEMQRFAYLELKSRSIAPARRDERRAGAAESLSGKSFDDVRRRLDELDQNSFAADRRFVASLRVDETDVEAGGAFADAARSKPHTFALEPLHGRGEIVDPQPDVIERRVLDLRLLLGVERLHQVDLDLERAGAHRRDVFVDVLALALEVARDREPERVDPQRSQSLLVESSDRYLLDSQNLERTCAHGASPLRRRSGRNLTRRGRQLKQREST
jgi:serine protease Do